MTKTRIIFCILLVLTITACNSQRNSTKMENNKNNPLLCDPEKGICEIPTTTSNDPKHAIAPQKKAVKIVYYTDPICSSCWGIEPQLRKLKLEYGNDIEIEYRMGGLLPDWSYNSGGISKPSDVAGHWDEVSKYYDMPIDGDVWLEDPLDSSYPPSIAFKAAQMQDLGKAVLFLRSMRELLFLQKKNITKWEHLESAAITVGLDPLQLKQDYENKAKKLFQEDLDLGKKLGVRGFPTLLFYDSLNNQQIVYGFKPYQLFEDAIRQLSPKTTKSPYDHSWTNLFKIYPTLTTREFAELSGTTKKDSEILLQALVKEGKLTVTTTKNGVIWSIKGSNGF